MPEDVKPGSWVGDSVEEFKKLPAWGKVAAAGVLVGVAGLGYYEYKKGQSGASTTPGTTATTDSGGAAAGGMQSPFGQVPTNQGNGTTVPVIPFGDTPILDGLGNLIGWQQPNPNPTPTPAPGGSFSFPDALKGMKIWQGTTTHDFFFGAHGPQPGRKDQTALSSLFPKGTTFQIINGQLFYALPGGSLTASGVNTVSGTPASHKKVEPPPTKKHPRHNPPPRPPMPMPKTVPGGEKPTPLK